MPKNQWFIKQTTDKINSALRNRMEGTISFLKNKTISNISVPVVRVGGVVERSSRGEFPRADTLQLKSTLITEVKVVSPGIVDGFLGSPMDYSLILEQRLDRRFLSRTLFEELKNVKKSLVGKEITFTEF